MVEGITPDETLDCRGLSCPMPLLKVKKTLKKMKSGQILEILGTDPGSKKDIPDYAKKQGDDFLGMEDESGYTRFLVKKGG
jgi:tRNA 2-thiouridine synthesizing protein A